MPFARYQSTRHALTAAVVRGATSPNLSMSKSYCDVYDLLASSLATVTDARAYE